MEFEEDIEEVSRHNILDTLGMYIKALLFSKLVRDLFEKYFIIIIFCIIIIFR